MPSTRLADCADALAAAWVEILAEYRASRPGRDLSITCTHRSSEEQVELYKIGRRQLADASWVVDDDPKTSIVTQCDGVRKKSNHNSLPATALDFACFIGGKVSWNPGEYEPVGVLAEARGLVWGGRWTFKDYPHVELTPGGTP